MATTSLCYSFNNKNNNNLQQSFKQTHFPFQTHFSCISSLDNDFPFQDEETLSNIGIIHSQHGNQEGLNMVRREEEKRRKNKNVMVE